MQHPGGEHPGPRHIAPPAHEGPAAPPPGGRDGDPPAPPRREEQRRTRFFLLALDLLAICDARGRLVDVNQAWETCLGYAAHDLAAVHLPELAHPDDAPLIEQELGLLARGVETVAFEARLRTRTGGYRWLLWNLSADPHSDALYAVGRDISAQKQTEAALRESEQRFRQLIDTAPDAVCVVDVVSGRVVFFNREEFCGYQRAELGPWGAIDGAVHSEDRQRYREHCARISTAPAGGASFDAAEYRLWRRDGGLEWVHSRAVVLSRDEAGAPRQVIFTLTLITERKHAEQLLDYQAHFDPVTGLPNRFFFVDRLEERVARAAANRDGFAVCFIDLDRFNQINDSLGHDAGDDVLAQVAERLRRAVDRDDVLARMGGDEFTLLLANTRSAEAASRVAQRILAALEEPLTLDGHELFISASVGISVYPLDGADAMTLLKHADSAMYRAKAAGRNSVSWFVPEFGRATVARLELGNQLRRAIDQQQFELHYQPQVELASGRVVGVEALIRWRHPERGLIPPGDFIAVAEESHLMARISGWVLQEACRQGARWREAGLPGLRVAVNISARQFERDDIVQKALLALQQAGLEPRWLDLEITESVLMRDPEGSAVRIEQLREMGVRVSIDDFGTGYSSLAYLQRFPVDTLKIDRSFVWALSEPADGAAALVQAIIALAHSLGLVVVAEGVETHTQHELLQRLGCDEAQGFLYARPAPPDELWETYRQLLGQPRQGGG
jgi:diguanylate cyclase (GGDEF)-like protein/PAS domain S-box-containing protein